MRILVIDRRAFECRLSQCQKRCLDLRTRQQGAGCCRTGRCPESPDHGRGDHQHIVERPWDLILAEAEGLPHQPLEAVAYHGVAAHTTDRHPQARATARVRRHIDSQKPITPAAALVQDRFELAIACQPSVLGKRQPAHLQFLSADLGKSCKVTSYRGDANHEIAHQTERKTRLLSVLYVEAALRRVTYGTPDRHCTGDESDLASLVRTRSRSASCVRCFAGRARSAMFLVALSIMDWIFSLLDSRRLTAS